MTSAFIRGVIFFALAIAMVPGSNKASAHCDGLDGPVVTAARQALDSGDVKRVLIWVRADDETEIRNAFNEAMTVRKLGPDARALADRYFFETLVRVHRAGEGAPYTGLKAAGRDLGPAIPAADAAIESGSSGPVAKLLTDKMREGLHAKFRAVMDSKAFAPDDVAAGREYVDAYVVYIHYVERLYEAAATASDGHYPEEH